MRSKRGLILQSMHGGSYKSQRRESPNGVPMQLQEAKMAKPDGYNGPLDVIVDYKTYEKVDFKFDAIICADLDMVSRNYARFEPANLLGLRFEYCNRGERLSFQSVLLFQMATRPTFSAPNFGRASGPRP